MAMLLLVLVVLAVAYANGANDVSKGVSTLVGSGLVSYRRGILWGTAWTVAGGMAAVAVGRGLLGTFGTGLLTAPPADPSAFFLAVATGAFGWVILASRTGLPVSTTHALTGAIVGTALAAGGTGGVRWPVLATAVALPLAASPLASAALACLSQQAFSARLRQASGYCVCVEHRPAELALAPAGVGARLMPTAAPAMAIAVDRAAECERRPIVLRTTDGAHWLASAALSFARGMNDNPKIAALGVSGLVATGMGSAWMLGAAAAAMGLGSYLFGRRVTATLAERVTEIEPLDGLIASSIACGLVLLASFVALPVSTTHVATGAIVGAGLRQGKRAVRWRTLAKVALAWVVTLPVAGILAAVAWRLRG